MGEEENSFCDFSGAFNSVKKECTRLTILIFLV